MDGSVFVEWVCGWECLCRVGGWMVVFVCSGCVDGSVSGWVDGSVSGWVDGSVCV